MLAVRWEENSFVAIGVTGPTFRHEGGSVSVASEVKVLI